MSSTWWWATLLLRALAYEPMLKLSALPKVFVVPLSNRFNDDLLWGQKVSKHGRCHHVFYNDEESGPYASEFDQEVWFHWELRTYPKLVTNPSEADLMYIPLYFRRYLCDERGGFVQTFRTAMDYWIHTYPAKTFFIVVGKVCSCIYDNRDPVWSTCHPFATFVRDGVDDRILASAIRVVSWERHSSVVEDDPKWKNLPPNIVMPYLAILGRSHVGNGLAFVKPTLKSPTEKRKILVLNTASAGEQRSCVHCGLCNTGFSPQQPANSSTCPQECKGIRPYLVDQLAGYPDDLARVDLPKNRTSHVQVLKVKEDATFCLEPPGDTMTRRSFYEDILLGCIPVVFRNDDAFLRQFAFSDYVPYRDMWVSIPADAVINSQVDVVAKLVAIPESEILEKRRLLAKWAPAFAYNKPKIRRQLGTLGPQGYYHVPLEDDVSPEEKYVLADNGHAVFHTLLSVWRAGYDEF